MPSRITLDFPAIGVTGQRTVVIEGFDRRWTKDNRLLRLTREDCCQALSITPTRKYETDGGPGIVEILELLKGSDDPERDRNAVVNGIEQRLERIRRVTD